MDGGRRGIVERPEGPVRRALAPEFELQAPGEVRPPPAHVNGYNVGIRGPVLQPTLQQQQQQVQLQPQRLPQPRQPVPNRPGPELQLNARSRPVREQMAELLGYVIITF